MYKEVEESDTVFRKRDREVDHQIQASDVICYFQYKVWYIIAKNKLSPMTGTVWDRISN